MNTKTILPAALLLLQSFCDMPDAADKLGIDRNAGPARSTSRARRTAIIRCKPANLLSPNWDFMATLSLTNSSRIGFDSASPFMPYRFYRALKLNSPVMPEYADDFRLTDHQGIFPFALLS